MRVCVALLVIHRVGAQEWQPHNSRESGKAMDTQLLLSPFSPKVLTNSSVSISDKSCLNILKNRDILFHALNVLVYTKAIFNTELGQYVLWLLMITIYTDLKSDWEEYKCMWVWNSLNF